MFDISFWFRILAPQRRKQGGMGDHEHEMIDSGDMFWSFLFPIRSYEMK